MKTPSLDSGHLAINGSKSDVSCSNHICYLYNLNKYSLNMNNRCYKVKQEGKIQRAGIIKDFMHMREDILLNAKDKSNVSEIIEFCAHLNILILPFFFLFFFCPLHYLLLFVWFFFSSSFVEEK